MIDKCIAIVLACALLCGCGKTDRQYYETGELLSKVSLDGNGKMDGKYVRFYQDGTTAEETLYKAGLREGTRSMYLEDGTLISKTDYSNDEMSGEHTVYHQNGKIQTTSTYENGKVQGKLLKYYQDGALAEKVTYKDDIENGPFEEYYPNGKIRWRGTYLNGENEFGLLENFDSTGVLIKKMMCDSMRICKTLWEKE